MTAAKKQDTGPYSKKRKHIRYPPDQNALALIKLLDNDGQQIGPDIVGLAIDESYEGCSIVLRSVPPLQIGCNCVVAVGALAPLPGKVVWLRELEPGIVRAGISINDEA